VTHRKTKKERELTGGKRGEGMGEEPNKTTAKMLGPL
jgi:hypothetical protein